MEKIVVTGCAGSIGSRLVEAIQQKYPKAKILAVDSNEEALFFQQARDSSLNTEYVLGNINSTHLIDELTSFADHIYHCAARKHVILCENSPDEAIKTNILAVSSLVSAALKNNVNKFIFTSSDKAVNPMSTMGITKLLGERLVRSAHKNSIRTRTECRTVFASTRFGNVLGSNGSVVEIFKRQLSQGLPLTITDENMSRFVMTKAEAVKFVLKASDMAQGGEIFVPLMPVISVIDLAQAMTEMLTTNTAANVRFIGAKPGEKFYEELVTSEEMTRSVIQEDMVIIDGHPTEGTSQSKNSGAEVGLASNSESYARLTVPEIKALLTQANVL